MSVLVLGAEIVTTARLEAFSDGFLAIVVTIIVLEMKVPRTAVSFLDIQPILAVLSGVTTMLKCIPLPI